MKHSWKIVNLWNQCRQFILFAFSFSKNQKAVWILNFGIVYQRESPPPVIPKPMPIYMHEQVVIKGNIFMVSYVNEGKRRITLTHLGSLRDEVKKKEAREQ